MGSAGPVCFVEKNKNKKKKLGCSNKREVRGEKDLPVVEKMHAARTIRRSIRSSSLVVLLANSRKNIAIVHNIIVPFGARMMMMKND